MYYTNCSEWYRPTKQSVGGTAVCNSVGHGSELRWMRGGLELVRVWVGKVCDRCGDVVLDIVLC
jgi:hypothetical protein